MPLTECGPYLVLAPDILSGPDCRVWSHTIICAGVSLGARCVVGSHCYVGAYATIGDDLHLQDGSHLTDGITIGHRVFIGARVVTMNDRHPSVARSERRRANPAAYVKAHIRPPVIEDDVMIGCGAVILPGVRLGQGCQIGAGAVVTKDVPAHEVWVGNPAKLMHRSARRLDDEDAPDWAQYQAVFVCGTEVVERPDA